MLHSHHNPNSSCCRTWFLELLQNPRSPKRKASQRVCHTMRGALHSEEHNIFPWSATIPQTLSGQIKVPSTYQSTIIQVGILEITRYRLSDRCRGGVCETGQAWASHFHCRHISTTLWTLTSPQPTPRPTTPTMAFEITRRRFLRTINSKYVYGKVVSIASIVFYLLQVTICVGTLLTVTRQPLVHLVIIFIELAVMSRLIAKFNGYYASRPSISTVLGNWGFADNT